MEFCFIPGDNLVKMYWTYEWIL